MKENLFALRFEKTVLMNNFVPHQILRPMMHIIVRYLLLATFIATAAIRIYKTMHNNNWTFRDYIIHRKSRLLLALAFIAFTVGYGVYHYQHLVH